MGEEKEGGVTVELGGDGKEQLVRRFRLEVTDGPDAGRAFVSTGRRMVVGTHKTVDLVLTDRAVSRFHCELTLDGGSVTIGDLESKNGTSVDGVSVERAHLADGAHIAVGQSKLRFSLSPDHVKVPLSERESFGQMVGRSPSMRAAFVLLERAAESDATVLLEGETGTGKEIAADGIHRESPRKDGPLVVVDCSAIPADLLESELFGHEKGAFTGADRQRVGAFEAAHSGTLFLDEIGELQEDLQPKLLRALESREVKRVGSTKPQAIDVRVIAATNRNLRAEVNAGRFRSDLYYRLAVLEVRLPPLRERKEDLPLLVENILSRLNAKARAESAFVRSPEFLAELRRHTWPGNVRELRNYVERCLALRMHAPLIDSPDAPVEELEGLPFLQARAGFERRYLEQLLRRHQNNVTAAAKAAQLDRIHLYRLLWRHGLK